MPTKLVNSSVAFYIKDDINYKLALDLNMEKKDSDTKKHYSDKNRLAKPKYDSRNWFQIRLAIFRRNIYISKVLK